MKKSALVLSNVHNRTSARDGPMFGSMGPSMNTSSLVHCTKNLKRIFPEMKLCGLIPNFYIYVSGRDLYISTICLIWNLYSPVLHEINLISTAGVERRAGSCFQAEVSGSSLLSPLLLWLSESSHE
jgi:hypothetical protein